ncbi:MAG TPA: histidine phosphatase family protein [Patescibacteria group bacterium]|nr:histidine phosphatase family protein [Patescibacteria group bacterium]
MKWPAQLVLIRHAQSEYNVLRQKKAQDPTYKEFVEKFDKGEDGLEMRNLALKVQGDFALRCSDRGTPITQEGCSQASRTAAGMKEALKLCHISLPDVIYVSPYLRARQTYEIFLAEIPPLNHIPMYEEERIREQDHGLSLLYNDWRVFHTIHSEQRKLYNLLGPYDYRYPNGENVPDVRMRVRDWRATLIREFRGKDVWAFTHHLTILGFLADQERWPVQKFCEMDSGKNKPRNCSITLLEAADGGRAGQGQLLRKFYNQIWY